MASKKIDAADEDEGVVPFASTDISFKRGGFVHKFYRAGVIVVVLLGMCGGVAAAEPNLANEIGSKHTDDGWDLTSSLTEMTINPVSNINASAFSREGFVTGTGTLTIARSDKLDCGKEDDRCLNSATLEMWVQLGCQVDLNQYGQFQSSPILNSDIPGLNLGNLLSILTGSNLATNTIGVEPRLSLNPQVQVNLKPGEIKEFSMGAKASPSWDSNEKKYSDPINRVEMGGGLSRVISVQDFHVEVDHCGGPVFARLRAKATMRTGHSDDEVSAYSATVQI